MNIPILRIKDENGQYQDIPAIKGAKGDKGDPGTNGVDGGYYEPSVSSNGDLSWTPSKSGMPDVATSNIKGPQGEQGPTGQTGPKGDTPNVTVGTTTTSDPGGDASVTKNSSSTEDNAIFDFVIPRGEQGPQGNPGSDGKSPTVNVGTTTTGPAGSQASVTNSGTETDAVFNFTIPVGIQGQRGEKGDTGDTGATPSINVGTTTTGNPGTEASVTKDKSSTETNVIFDFTIPRGDKGETGSVGPQGPTGPTGATFTPSVSGEGIISWTNDKGLDNPSSVDIKGPQGDRGPQGETGQDGKAATISVGTTTSGDPGEQASVTNSGTSSDAVFNFVIPRGEQGTPGNDGITPEISAGKTVTGNPGTSASVVKDSTSTESNVIFNFTIPRGDKGEQGNPGPQGQSATIEVGSTVTGQPGSKASVTNSGTSSAAVFNFTIPEGQKGNPGNDGEKGDPGAVFTPSVSDEGIISWTNNGDLPNPTSVNIRGPQGIQGSKGDAATVSVGETTTVDPGTEASVTNSGTSSAAVFNFSIPKGEKGDQGIQGNKGDPGEAATIEIGTTTTGLPGSQASVTNSGTSEKAVFNFSIPKGEKGNTGDTGPRGEAATVSVGTTTTGDPGGSASVTNSGTSSDAVFNFVIPRGQQGTPGQDGISPTVSVGTTTTGQAGSQAIVQNSGTETDVVLDFTIPRGIQGDKGDNGSTFTPSVSESGIISWTNDGGLPNPSPQNIRGPQGQNGSPGLYVGNSAPSDANIRLWVKPVDDYVFSYSNPNLLINSNFMDPINQRGETTYSGNAYGIDRWKGATVGSSIGISGSGVFITGQITQYVEMKSSNIGRTMTMSSCDSNGNIKSITGELDTSSVSGNNMSFVYNGSKYSIAASIGGGTRYRWVKLEFGSSPTLYVPRSRAEEVMLCLRYYWRIQQTNSDFNYFGGGIANASTNTYFTINLPVYMRDFPELGYGGNFQCYGGNGNFPIGSLAESPFTSTTDPIDDQTSTYTLVAVRNGGSQTAGHVYNLNGTTPGSYIEFDSEIY